MYENGTRLLKLFQEWDEWGEKENDGRDKFNYDIL
jgi:hypothetical protein